jgi:hypothetical protein
MSARATITSRPGCKFRTRANCVFALRYADSRRTGAIAENATIELHFRSRNSLSHLQKPFDLFAKGSETGDWLLR